MVLGDFPGAPWAKTLQNPVHRAQVQSLVRTLDHACCNYSSHSTTKIWHSQMKEKRYLDSGKLGRMVSKARHLPALGNHDFLTCKYFELLLTHWLETACITADQRPEGHGVSIVMMTTYKLDLGVGVRDWRASRLKAQHGGPQRSGEHTDNELSAASASIPGGQQ